MQTINLKQYYPFCTEDTFVEVSDEIAEAFLLDKRAEAARERKMYRYKAFYSLDCNDGIENAAIGWAQPSPEDCLMEKEAQAEYAELLRRLYEALATLTPAQARRVHARYMLGMKVKDIAAMEGITPSGGKVHPCGAPAAAPVLHTPEMDKRPMKTINLKKYYYPLYETDTFIELPDEIADAIVEEWRTDHNSEQRLWSHTYSMDYSPGLEYHLLYHALSAEDTLLEEETRREQEEAHELMLQRLREALATLTPTQARRLHARFVEGKKYREIAEDEGIASVSLVTNTVRDAILKLRKYFIKRGWMEPLKEDAICTKKSPPKHRPSETEKRRARRSPEGNPAA